MITFEAMKIKGIHKLEIPGDGLELGLPEIRGIVFSLYKEWIKNHSPLDYFPVLELLTENWCWKEGEGKTLPQRISKILNKNGFQLAKSYLGDLGNSIREAIPMLKEYYIDITQDFNWEDGDFGDQGSCMWEGRSTVRSEMTKDGRFYAFRFFKPQGESSAFWNSSACYSGYIGTGRTWLFKEMVQIRINKRIHNEEILILFNSYGHALRQQAAILATLTGLASKSISLSNKKMTSGGLYINGRGYIIGPPHIIKTIDHFDFGFDNKFDGLDEPYDTIEIMDDSPDTHRSRMNFNRQRRKRQSLYFDRNNRRAKRIKKRGYKIINNTIDSMTHSFNKGTIYHLLRSRKHWGGNKATNLYHWKLYDHLLKGYFFSILMKILSHKITNGGLNDNPKKKT